MSTHNISFDIEIWKIIIKYPLYLCLCQCTISTIYQSIWQHIRSDILHQLRWVKSSFYLLNFNHNKTSFIYTFWFLKAWWISRTQYIRTTKNLLSINQCKFPYQNIQKVVQTEWECILEIGFHYLEWKGEHFERMIFLLLLNFQKNLFYAINIPHLRYPISIFSSVKCVISENECQK